MERWAAAVSSRGRRRSSMGTSAAWAGRASSTSRARLRAAVNLRISHSLGAARAAWQWSVMTSGSEGLAQGELEELGVVAALVVDRLGDAKGERPHRRQPGEPHADAVAQVAQVDAGAAVGSDAIGHVIAGAKEGIARVNEQRGLQGAAILDEGQREEQRSEEHTSELQSRPHLVCRLLLEKKKV